MMASQLGLLSMLFLTVTCEFISDSGWTPISREKAVNPGNFIKTQVYGNSQTDWNSDADSTFTGEIHIKLPDSREMYEGFYPRNLDVHRKDVLPPTNSDEREDNSFEHRITTEIPLKLNIERTETLRRKAKKMNDKNYSAKENLIEDIDANEDTFKMDRKAINDKYAVTEHVDDDVIAESSIGEDFPPLKEVPRHNPTDDFIKILANYNIRSSDRLPNYALSRQNSRHSNKFIYMPLRIAEGFNSPNHLLVDPLLAVFLSNYGYYLPGLYGITGNYRNLYGYVAANNIHNNQPFGSYKIYSDTDSSH
ncbi:uncharacterized protein LOC123695104 [Colias croceus]|uniref:uncharacterized protein LOC123695104 n=1 Tax=Colias crocea TaxID=72248 RepID=UPI001E27C0CA|nr:uncharacterized protein LOC123695104 [Colias croceus]